MKKFLKKITVAILTFEAKQALRRHRPQIIAITGSVGKTSTKDAIYAVVSSAFETRKSEKSMNSEIGLPLAILGLENAWSSLSGWTKNIYRGALIVFSGNSFPQWLILEVGADHPKDIENIAKWLRPDIVVLTRMADVPVHIEFFKNADEVLREKMFLAEAVKSLGTLVVNADDPYFVKAVKDLAVNKVFYGQTKECLARIIENEVIYDNLPLALPRGQYSVIDIKGQKNRVELKGIVGNHIMYPIAAACSVASILNISDNLPNILKCLEMPRGRMKLLEGKSKSVIIDDSYNSSPLACIEALKTIESLSVKGKKIAALGDMKELGTYSEKAHREVGKLAGGILHTLITVGEMARDIAVGAQEAGMSSDRIFSFETSGEAKESVSNLLRAGDVILVKGSQSMRMEKIIEISLENPSQARELLVRQEEEWKKR